VQKMPVEMSSVRNLSTGITTSSFLRMCTDFVFRTSPSPSIFQRYVETRPCRGRSLIWNSESCHAYYRMYAWKCKISLILVTELESWLFPVDEWHAKFRDLFHRYVCRYSHYFTQFNP
jgi:hypothetical protein